MLKKICVFRTSLSLILPTDLPEPDQRDRTQPEQTDDRPEVHTVSRGHGLHEASW